MMMRITTRVLTLSLVTMLTGCPATNEPEVLPGIPADARLIDLDEAQGRTLCLFQLEAVGADPATGGRRVCSSGFEARVNSLEVCMADRATLPMRAPDCPTLVRSEVNFWRNIRDNCDAPDFDPRNFEGQRACIGP
jgi:hypothetical protein